MDCYEPFGTMKKVNAFGNQILKRFVSDIKNNSELMIF